MKNADSVNAIKRTILALNGDSTLSEDTIHQDEIGIDIPKLVFVSGTGWSGSSAIFDFLREFKEVVPIDGESPIFAQGPSSLLKVLLAASSSESFRARMLDFFFAYLIGFRAIKEKWDLLFMAHARKFVFGENSQYYLRFVEKLAHKAYKALSSDNINERESIVQSMAMDLLKEVLLESAIDNSKVVVLDNVINVRYLEAIRLFDRAHSYCCFRDPRSNYVSLKKESSHYVPPAEEWARFQGKKISDLEKNYDALSLKLQSNKLVRLQFEEFVLSESYRNELAISLGLNLEERTRHRYFKPWESLRNVMLHEEYQDQNEIDIIERELSHLCCDVKVVRLNL